MRSIYFLKHSEQRNAHLAKFLQQLDSKNAFSYKIVQEYLYEFCKTCDSLNLGDSSLKNSFGSTQKTVLLRVMTSNQVKSCVLERHIKAQVDSNNFIISYFIIMANIIILNKRINQKH